MKTFTKAQIEIATKDFFERLGKENFEVKNFSIEDGDLGDKFTCECNIHGNFDEYDFFLEKISKRSGDLIVGRK